ncbi:hypothetical protein BV898_12073 [Hypsibius exemplaris]|uniref:Tautomerase cis-CaaD-like domain-containing protein n=1 Tax=Hypsibius exemplaris TaxID=2072580 RepID=A0A1W0WER0_HYPEX|nr:hypothetical protein BV898_12073 [Hypsibius exemplaris]
MPLHRIFHHPSAFTQAEKQSLTERITEIYTGGAGLPPFYVVVLFISVNTEDFFVGGKTTDKFVRIVVQHLARQIPNKEGKKAFSDKYEAAIAPFIKDKGFDWEVATEEVPPDMWRENGLTPPAPNTPAEKEWFRLNRPAPYEGKSFLDL